MFIQIHTLTGYSGVLLNRDDSGMAKRMPYGDAVRTRISSQFAKRKIRKASGEHAVERLGDVAVRSRETFKREIAQPLIDAGHDRDAVVAATVCVMDEVYPLSDKAKKDRKKAEKQIEDGEEDLLILLERGEINVLSRAEIEFVKDLVEGFVAGKSKEEAVVAASAYVKNKDFKANLRQVGSCSSLDVAMFGRMVTGDSLSSVDAAVHVAHALTTHPQATESDFFTAVDDLVTTGTGHVGETELTSPLLYGYYVVDWNQLMHNLQGVDNRIEVGARLVESLVHLVSEHVVGAKKGGTAPYSSSDVVFVETGSAQPRTLAEAFRSKVGPTLNDAITSLERYLEGKDRMYGVRFERFNAATVEMSEVFGKQVSVPELGQIVAERIASGA